MCTELISFGLGTGLGGLIVGLLLRHFLPAYLGEKGKNLATKEDIAGITHEIERTRAQYSLIVEELKAHHQLRMAALDERLKAHQEAFTLWRKLVTGPEESGKAILECQTWWEKNCLYLEPAVREAFVSAYMGAHLRAVLVRARGDSTGIMDAWNRVLAFPDVLFKAIQLPPLSEIEAKELKELKEKAGG